MKTLSKWSDLPEFDSEADEAAFWAQYQLDPHLIKSSLHNPDSRESTTVTLRFDPRMLSKIKRIAKGRYLNYQSMVKQWLAERIEEEQARGQVVNDQLKEEKE